MVDVVDAKTRSRMMSGIRGRNTKPEILIRSMLHQQGFRFRLHIGNLPGKPDIVLAKYNTVIFVHGCFWHQHKKCIDGRIPSSNKEYWRKKLELNIERDRKNMRQLHNQNWKVVVVWECEIEKKIDKVLLRLRNKLVI